MKLSIIIVNYKTKDLTAQAVASVKQSDIPFTYELIVVDNGSHDGSVSFFQDRFPDVNLIASEHNEGFAKANNKGMRVSSGEYILLLNSDTMVKKDTLKSMVELMDREATIGAAGCKVVLPDGSLDQACHRGFPTPEASFFYMTGLAKRFPKSQTFNQYHMGYLDLDTAHPVDCLVGAFLLVRRKAVEEVGLLDEDFFMYGEDIDWCYRMNQAGWVNYYYPQVEILHLKRGGKRKQPFKLIYEFHRSMILFYKKHYLKKYNILVTLLVYLGIGIKFSLSSVKNALISPR